MCCSLRTQTMVAAVICCFVTSCSVCDEISNRICFFFCDDLSDFLSNESDGRGDIFEDLVKVAVYVFCMVSDVLCLFGAQQNKKCLLLPFIFKTCLSILGLSVSLIFLISFGSRQRDLTLIFYLIFTLLSVMFGLYIYFLVISIKFFRENSDAASRRTEVTVLQPVSSQPIARSTDVSNHHLHLGDQNQACGYQEQPPAYHLQDHPKRNEEMKSDYRSNQV